jgi:hypothetical protein
MIELCKKYGNKPPKFEESTGSFSVMLPFKEKIARVALLLKLAATLTDRQRDLNT